jgi:insulysin
VLHFDRHTQTVIFAKSIKKIHTIDISCGIPPQDLDYRSRPANFISHLVGHEGNGSLHSFLKNKGWITDLSTAAQSLGRGFDILRAVIQVTPAGLGEISVAIDV